MSENTIKKQEKRKEWSLDGIIFLLAVIPLWLLMFFLIIRGALV